MSNGGLYDQHKKYHDLVQRVQELAEDEYARVFLEILDQKAHEVFAEYKKKGVTDLKELSSEELRKITDGIFDAAVDHVARNYLKFSDSAINELMAVKTVDGTPVLNSLMRQYLGFDKNTFFDEIKRLGEITPKNKHELYTALLRNHTRQRSTDVIKDVITEYDDMEGVFKYLTTAQKHNPKSLKGHRLKDKYKSIDEAAGAIASAAGDIPEQYHPDKSDTYN